MQVAGAAGFAGGLSLERRLRDARGGLCVDGTNETLRCFIALAGLRGPGERMDEVERAIYEPVKGFGLLRDFAVRKVREAIRRERMSRAHPLLAREAVLFEEATDDLSLAAQRVLRDHGREIAEMQQIQVRIANVVIDLWALGACISRTTLAIEQHGESGARRELDLTAMFASAARGRMRANLAHLEHNDDALRKLIAARAYTDGGYPFDVL
jgi:acyl-CoA dehydrogenase family protein 9